MSILWYPVIDNEKCIRCGTCIQKCPHGVYDRQSIEPLVIHPENCIEGCHGCQNRCPSGAIQYFGDFGSNQSYSGEYEKPARACEQKITTVNIDFLYLDLTTCVRCQKTASILKRTIFELSEKLKASGYKVTLQKIHIDSLEKAKIFQFSLSPTIRVNGEDIALTSQESACKECGELCNDQINCRLWSFRGKEYDEPPMELLMETIIQIITRPKSIKMTNKPYETPLNLIRFFDSLEKKKK